MERVGQSVKRELAQLGPAAAAADLTAAWPAAVGEVVARNAWPARIGRDGTLHVNTSSSTWAFELKLLEARIAARLRELVGDGSPRRLRFVPGPVPEPDGGGRDTPVNRHPQPSPADAARARAVAAPIGDEEVRDAVAKALAAGLAKQGADHRV